jgi:hypothetical protein
MTLNTTAAFILLTQATATSTAVLTWNTAALTDIGTYHVTIGATSNSGLYYR